MSFITDEYRKLNEALHKDKDGFGKSGSRWAIHVYRKALEYKTQDILDYGCGKSTLSLHLPFTIHQYDPCVPKYAELPEPSDIVICTDVLEHIEPHLLDDVVKHLCGLVKKFGLFSVCNVAALKNLPDGRNAHLIQANTEWWANKISQYVDIIETEKYEKESVFYVKPKVIEESKNS